MTGKIFDILSASIAQDQANVVRQLTKTFLHNKNDLATNMVKLSAACIAKGQFEIRPYMATSDEYQAPSNKTTIADFLGHGSRIIYDYEALSAQNRKEFLDYFPLADETNKVLARSATHAVLKNQQGVIIEEKRFVLGVIGQLPSFINECCDFGINIAIGGAGKKNFYGKKISANGFSGHYYYHHNQKDKLLLAGLEQTAPTNTNELLNLKKWISSPTLLENEQHGTDQFGQGHSLVGASDKYTSAGSLYFSDPVYQAKLMVEKGIFPPQKYNGMKVTLNNDNWAEIKTFLADLNQSNSISSLLFQAPSTAVEASCEYKSYVALDFSGYLKQVNNEFVQKNTLLSESNKNSLNEMEARLLGMINHAQIGNMQAYSQFTEMLSQILAIDFISGEYKVALQRIGQLFQRQIRVDPLFENTQIKPGYSFGDYTLAGLQMLNQWVNPASKKQYEIGNITKGILSYAGSFFASTPIVIDKNNNNSNNYII